MAEKRRSYSVCGLAMCLAALLLIPGIAQGEQWYLVSTGQNGDRFYVDADSIQLAGTDLKAWVRVDYKEPKPQGLFKSKITQALDSNLLDCGNKRTKLLSRYSQDTTGARIPEDLGTFSLSYADALPGSVSLAILGFACGRGRELAAKGIGSAVVPPDIWRSDWRPVATRQDGAKIFVAANRIEQVPERRAGTVTFYELVMNRETQNVGSMPVKSEITLWMSSCQGGAMGSLGAAYYNDGQEVLFRSEPASVNALQPPPNTIGRYALDFVCVQPVALGSAPDPRASAPAQANTRPDAAPKPAPKPGTADKPEFMFGSGTAWYVDAGYFVTAFHVIDGAAEIVLYGADRTPLRARVTAADAKNDVAILTVDLKDRKLRPLSLNKGAAALGSHVFTIGYPHSDVLGVSPKITSGEVSGNLPLDPTKLLISVPVQSGNSGGPLVNMSGEVVGLVIEKLPADVMLKATGDVTENTNFALKARYIDALLEDLPRLPTAVAPAKPKASSLEDLVATYRDSVYFVLTRVPVTDPKEARK